MPKYTNANATVVSIGGLRLEPGESKTTLEFIPGSLPSGVTEVATAPTFQPIILSQKLTAGATVTIPDSYVDPLSGATINLTGNYLVSMYATGEATVQLNGAGVARYLGTEDYPYEVRCLSRVVDTVVCTVASGVLYVTVEKI
jgi:hypothetical protein